MRKCPFCGATPEQEKEEAGAIRALCLEHGLMSEYVDPGGRELVFFGGRRIHVSDCCMSCDAKDIRSFLLGGVK